MKNGWKVFSWNCRCGRKYSYNSYVKMRNMRCICGRKLALKVN